MLPRPALSFTLPSIHDGTKLDCRIFHPESLNPGSKSPPWARHVAVVAHPYAPLGGNYDDPIVDLVGGTLLEKGFMIATFNFRGASLSSTARTSWTSRAECADYMSVVGFLVYYTHYLNLPARITISDAQRPIIIQAGYSYGAMVVTKLPPLHLVLAKFECPTVHSAAADVRLRAQHLADQQLRLFDTPASPRRSLGMRMGGEQESPPKGYDPKRPSFDREDKIRKGVKDLLAKTKVVPRGRKQLLGGQADGAASEEECMEAIQGLPQFRSVYLAVSPPVGLATSLATMSFTNPFANLSRRMSRGAENSLANHEEAADAEDKAAELKLVRCPTLVIYGDQDGFVQLKKIREWATRLQRYENSLLRKIEIPEAGHFWVEEGAYYELRDAIGTFAALLLNGEDSNANHHGHG